MDSSDVIKETAENFEDATYDPELEARLYAEIYHSNCVYSVDGEAAGQANTEPTKTVQNVTSSSCTQTSVPSNGDVVPNPLNVQHNAPAANFLHDNGLSQPCTQGINPSSESTLLEKRASHSFQYRKTTSLFLKPRRLLAQANLWCRKDSTREPTPSIRQTPVQIPRSPANSTCRQSVTKSGAVRSSIGDVFENRHVKSVELEYDRVSNDHIEPQKRVEKTRKKRKRLSRTKALSSIEKLCDNQYAVKRAQKSLETSKYGVVSKKTKLNMKEANLESLQISSDSDDSILEVPVPPKAQPPVIQLLDSDDECSVASDASVGNRSEFAGTSRADQASVEETGSSISEGISSRSTEDTPPTGESNDGTAGSDGGDLILNCTGHLPTTSNPEKNSVVQRVAVPAYTHSDDSMTESEANNWSNIATSENNATGNHDASSANKSMNQSYDLLWDQLSLDNSTGQHPSRDSTDPSLNAIVNSTIRAERADEPTERAKRKRGKNAQSRSLDNEISLEMPEKRSRGNSSGSSRSKSMVEYFFTPMSKELQVFYNSPCGDDNMDLFDIQKRMPKNPRYWPILDADLRPLSKRYRKQCSHCKQDMHWGKQCSQKPPQPVCSMCGAKGHVETRCPQTMCLTCGHEYTSYRQTCCRCFKLSCDICNGIGHTRENCPDLWRRYHDTTTNTQPTPKDPRNTMKSSQNLSCCNCAKRGHDATMCKQLRWSQHFPTPMYVTSYTDGPTYPTFRQEHVENSNPDERAEVVETTEKTIDRDVVDPLIAESTIFHHRSCNFSEATAHHEISIPLDTLKNVHMNGLLAGTTMPEFLKTLPTSFEFEVSVIRGSDNLTSLIIRSNDKDVMSGVNKLMMQWFSRRDEDKDCLRSLAVISIRLEKLSSHLVLAFSLLQRIGKPIDYLKKIAMHRKNLESSTTRINAPINTTDRSYPGFGDAVRAQRKQINDSSRRLRKCQRDLTVSLYKNNCMNDNGRTLGAFCKLTERLGKATGKFRVCDYIEMVYLRNEIFTFHEDDALLEAIERVKLCELLMNPGISSSQPVPEATIAASHVTSSVDVTADRVVRNEESNVEGSNSEADEQPTLLGNSTTEIDSTPVSQSVTARRNETTDNPPMSLNLDTTLPCNTNTASCSALPHELVAPNFAESRSLHWGMWMTSTGHKKRQRKKDDGVELLIAMKKNQRKLYRRAAKSAIRKAESSNIPILQKMAKQVKAMLADNTIRTVDIAGLRKVTSEMQPAKKKKTKQFTGTSKPRGQTPDHDCAYKNFLQNL